MPELIKLKIRHGFPEPTLDERKSFWRWSYARQCFLDVDEMCKALLHDKTKPAKTVQKALLSATVVSYAKPFTRWHGVGSLDHAIVPPQHRKLHSLLMDLRNKVFAHIDPRNFQADDPSFGNINQVRIQFSNGEWAISVMNPGGFDVTELKLLATKLREKADHWMDRFSRKYLVQHNMRDGLYLINLDASKPGAFIPVHPKHSII